MTRMAALAPTFAVAATIAVSLTSCGGNDVKLLPGETASEITANLDTVKQLADEGDCVGAESAAREVGEQIEGLAGIDAKLKAALENGAARLSEVVVSCQEATAEATVPSAPSEIETAPEKPKKEHKESKAEEEESQEEEVVPQEGETPPPLPPQANGEAKGHEKGTEEEAISGGVSPGAPAGEGD